LIQIGQFLSLTRFETLANRQSVALHRGINKTNSEFFDWV